MPPQIWGGSSDYTKFEPEFLKALSWQGFCKNIS
ncbi:unnamed protein product [Brassica oleracea var. botrytis]